MPKTNKNTSSFNAKLIHSILQLVKHHGLNIQQALSHTGIKQEDIDNPGNRYSIETFRHLLEFLVHSTKNHRMVALAAEAAQPRMLGSLGFVMTTANTLQEAYLKLEAYVSLIYEGINITVDHDKEHLTLTLDFEQDSLLVKEFFICCLLNWPRWLTGQTIPALHISFNQQKDNNKKHLEQLATQVKYNQPEIKITFSNKYINLPCLEANNEMHQLHCVFADSLMYRSSKKHAIIAQTKHHIRHILNHSDKNDNLSIRREKIAQDLNMSLRTFQRKLSALDTSFQQIYDNVRRETCLQFINQTDISFGQITYKLGYANLSAFQKAFRRWMNLSPTEYRKNILLNKPSAEEAISNNELNKYQWFDKVPTIELKKIIAEKLTKISSFSLELICLSGLIILTGKNEIPLNTLASIMGNSIARINIYLWPLQQQELIQYIEIVESDLITFSLSHIEIANNVTQLYSNKKLTSFHYSIASYYQLHDIERAIEHYNLCQISLLNHFQIEQLFSDCHKQSTLPKHQENYNLLNHLYELMIQSQTIISDDLKLLNDLRIKQLSFWNKLALFEASKLQYDKLLKEPLNINQSINLTIIASEFFVETGRTREAIILLQGSACTIFGLAELKSELNDVLITISEQITDVRHYYSTHNSMVIRPSTEPPLTEDIKLKLKVLRTLIIVCLRANETIVAAGAIVKMFSITLKNCDYYFSSFASAHFSWIAFSFAGDIDTTLFCRERAIALATKYSKDQLDNCKAILLTKIEHWLTPLHEIKSDLSRSKIFSFTTNKATLQMNILALYLALCTGKKIKTIKQDCFILAENFCHKTFPQINLSVNSLLSTLNNIEAEMDADLIQVEYENSTLAFNQLFKAFYNFEYDLWPSMQYWDSRIESEIANHYIVTEAVFMCSIIRLHLDKDKRHSKQSRYQGDLARIHSWGLTNPENFMTQYSILKAVYHSKFDELSNSINQFERTKETIDRYGYLHHKILYYHLYAVVLKGKYSTLSLLCKEKEVALKQQWLSS